MISPENIYIQITFHRHSGLYLYFYELLNIYTCVCELVTTINENRSETEFEREKGRGLHEIN